MYWQFSAKADGGMNFPNDGTYDSFKKDLLENTGAMYEVTRLSEESKNQRRFFEGAVIRLWCFLDKNNRFDSRVLKKYREYAKEEFNGEVLYINGKLKKVGKSSKGILNEFTEKVIAYLEENYAINRKEVLDPKHYKDFRDRIFMNGNFKDYIEYLVYLGRLK